MGSSLSSAGGDADKRETARPGTRPPRVKAEKLPTFLSLSLRHWHWGTPGPGGAGLKVDREVDQANLAGGARGGASPAPWCPELGGGVLSNRRHWTMTTRTQSRAHQPQGSEGTGHREPQSSWLSGSP